MRYYVFVILLKVRFFHCVFFLCIPRHYCDVKGWLQPTIKALGADGLPSESMNTVSVPPTSSESFSAVQSNVATGDIETEAEVDNEEEEQLSSSDVILSDELD